MKTQFHIIKHESKPAAPALPWLWSHWIQCQRVQIENGGCPVHSFHCLVFLLHGHVTVCDKILLLEHVAKFGP